MVKNKATIVFDYLVITRQANNLEEIAQSLGRDSKMLNEYKDELKAYWTGENSKKFSQKIIDNARNIDEIKRILNEHARVIKIIAKRNYDTEMQALEISKNRSYRS